jgi:hypothetical protein
MVAVAGGCADTATCDPNEILYMGHCMSPPTQGPDDAGSTNDMSADAGTGDDGAADAGPGDAGDEH